MSRFVSVIAAWVSLLLASGPAMAAKHAFVVGIGKYDNLSAEQQLPRARTDATAVGAALKRLDFEVVTANDDLTLPRFNALWQSFLDKVRNGDTVTLFISSHGVHIDGVTYLMPRDVPRVQATRQEQLKRSAISVSELLTDVKRRQPRVTVLILDACRNNPFEPNSTKGGPGPGGLGGITAPLGTLVMYAAGEGEKALEKLPDPPGHAGPEPFDTDPYSLYTRRLLPLLAEKGLDAVEMARRLKGEVRDVAYTAGHFQSPSYYDNIVGKFCFAGCDGEAAGQQPSPPRMANAMPPAPPVTIFGKPETACQDLKTLAKLAEQDFASIKGAQTGEQRWQSTALLAGYKSCKIERIGPSVSLGCEAAPAPSKARAVQQVADRVKAAETCLAAEWTKAKLMDDTYSFGHFSGGSMIFSTTAVFDTQRIGQELLAASVQIFYQKPGAVAASGAARIKPEDIPPKPLIAGYCEPLKKAVDAGARNFDDILGRKAGESSAMSRIQLQGWQDCRVYATNNADKGKRYFNCELPPFPDVAQVEKMLAEVQADLGVCLGADWSLTRRRDSDGLPNPRYISSTANATVELRISKSYDGTAELKLDVNQ